MRTSSFRRLGKSSSRVWRKRQKSQAKRDGRAGRRTQLVAMLSYDKTRYDGCSSEED